MSQESKERLTHEDYLQLLQAPMTIAGAEVFIAEPTVSRMDGINELIGFDIWEKNPLQEPRVHRLLLVRFDGDEEKVRRLCELTLREVPEGFDFDKLTGLELGVLLQGFFMRFHVQAGTIALSQKLMQLPTLPTESRGKTSPTRSRRSKRSKARSSG
ncbi:MAG: hypothetical protein MI685_10330 [Chlorobiales bacterium]|nr:hypothetical protein [Chlorobiales bacterium]